MLQRSTLQLLRFHFSLFLLPVYLFAISQIAVIDWKSAGLVFCILHFLVYPASNGYNSYMDRDETPIGGLAKPMQPTRQLFYVTLIMDAVAVALSLLINKTFTVGILFYILASRAYSNRKIRLKRFAIIGFLTVFICQGALIYYIVNQSCSVSQDSHPSLVPVVIASLLIGALYPLTQIYQHEEDKRDGVVTISYKLGKRGSFIFSGVLFLAATLLFYCHFSRLDQLNYFLLFLLITFPVVLFFCYWMLKVWRDESAANFKNSLMMNIIATLGTTTFFATLIILKDLE